MTAQAKAATAGMLAELAHAEGDAAFMELVACALERAYLMGRLDVAIERVEELAKDRAMAGRLAPAVVRPDNVLLFQRQAE